MKKGEVQVSRKVLKKLSAVRAVLRKDERDVLDGIVLGEVQAHVLRRATTKAVRRATAKKQVQAHLLRRPTQAVRRATAKKQVQAHLLRRPTQAVRRATAKKQVQAHLLRATAKAARRATANKQVQAHLLRRPTIAENTIPPIEFDPDLKEYQPIPE